MFTNTNIQTARASIGFGFFYVRMLSLLWRHGRVQDAHIYLFSYKTHQSYHSYKPLHVGRLRENNFNDGLNNCQPSH